MEEIQKFWELDHLENIRVQISQPKYLNCLTQGSGAGSGAERDKVQCRTATTWASLLSEQKNSQTSPLILSSKAGEIPASTTYTRVSSAHKNIFSEKVPQVTPSILMECQIATARGSMAKSKKIWASLTSVHLT